MQKLGLGRELARRLAHKLPHMRAGRKILVRRSDLDAYLEKAAQEELDLWEEAKRPSWDDWDKTEA